MLTGETLTNAVRTALSERLARERLRRRQNGKLAAALTALGHECASLPDFDARRPEDAADEGAPSLRPCTMPIITAPVSGTWSEVMHAAGLPKGVCNMVQGEGGVVGAAMSAHPDIDMMSFTGSTRAGILVAQAAATTVKRVSQELGGKSADVKNNMRIAQEEIFGPVISAIPFTDLDDVIAPANATDFGLSSGVWTSDVGKAHKLSRAIRAGVVWINCYGAMDPAVPFGGYKMSGYGREGGSQHVEEYLNVKAVWIKTG